MESVFLKLSSMQIGAVSVIICVIALVLWSVARAAYLDYKDEQEELLRRYTSFNIKRGIAFCELVSIPIISKFLGIALLFKIKKWRVVCRNPTMNALVYNFTLPIELKDFSFLFYMDQNFMSPPNNLDWVRIDAFIKLIQISSEEYPEFVKIKYEELDFNKAISKIFEMPYIRSMEREL